MTRASSNRKRERRLYLGGKDVAQVVSGLRYLESFFNTEFPSWASTLDGFRELNGRDGLPKWPECCLMPMAASGAIVSRCGEIQDPTVWILLMQEMSALYAWRQGRGVYCFDEDLANGVIQASGIDELPVEAIMHLPEWGVCIVPPKALDFPKDVLAFIAYLEWDTAVLRRELRIALLVKNGCKAALLYVQPLHIDRSTIQEALTESLTSSNFSQEDAEQVSESKLPQMRQIVALLAYLGSTSADIVDPSEKEGKGSHSRQHPQKTERIHRYDVGFRIGAQLRKVNAGEKRSSSLEANSSGRGKISHMRRAHWHHYWTGPKSNPDARTLIVHWIPPTLIGAGELIPALREVS